MVTLGVSVYPDLRPMKEIRSYLKSRGTIRIRTGVYQHLFH